MSYNHRTAQRSHDGGNNGQARPGSHGRVGPGNHDWSAVTGGGRVRPGSRSQSVVTGGGQMRPGNRSQSATAGGESSADRRVSDKVTITGGEFRGIKIETPGGNVHPMGARERLAVFNMIQDYLPEARILDAFAGSGALGLESLSRGAKFVAFLDNNKVALQTIKQNLQKLGLGAELSTIIQATAENFCKTEQHRYTVVFADPPYDKYLPEMIINLSPLVAPAGILVASTPTDPPLIPGMKIVKTRKYARCHITIYEKCEAR